MIEIEDARWDRGTRTLSAVSLGPPHTSHNVYVYVPGGHRWTWGGYVLFRDYDSYSLKLVHENVVEVHVRFQERDRVHWKLEYDDLFR